MDPGSTTPSIDMPVTIKEELVTSTTPEPTLCPVEVKQEIINDMDENLSNIEPNEQPVQLEMIDKVKEEIPVPSCASSAAPSPVQYGPPVEEPAATEECAPPVQESSQYANTSSGQTQEETAVPNPQPYPGPIPQNIKMEPVDIASSPPPPAIHEPVHHPHVYASPLPSSSQAHFSNSISIAVTNSSVTGSISASSSISLSYHNHSKMPYSGHSTLITTSQSMSAFNYRPFSPQYPYAPGLPPFPQIPPQPIKHKYNSGTSDSPSNSHTPPPTSSPYTAPPALPQPYQDSPPPPPKSHSHSTESTSTFPRSTQSASSTVQSPPVTSHSSVSHQSSAHGSSKSPSYSMQNQNSQSSTSQKAMPQPAHQSSLYPQLGMNQQTSHKGNNHPHQLPRPHPLSQLHSTGLPTSSQHLPPTTYVSSLPHQVAPQMHSSERQESEKCSVIQEPVTIEEEEETEPHFPFRGPSPEPRVEDVECHRSQSAM